MATQLQGTLLKSTIGVNNIKRSVMSFNKSIISAKNTTVKINQSLSQTNREKQRAISVSSANFQRRKEAVRRREQEDIVEASTVGGAIKRQGKVITSSTKGFLGRIMDFIGTVAVGWLINNLPIIIRLGEQLIDRGLKLLGVLRSFIGNITTILSGFGGLLVGTFRNLIAFDFSDQKQIIDNSLSTVQTGMIGIQNDINAAITLLTKPLDLGFDQLDFDEGGPEPAAPEGVPGGEGTMGTAYGVDIGRLATATGAAEGDYDSVGVTVKGGGHGLGRYQFMTYRSDTMAVIRKNAKAMGEEAIAEDLLKRANGSDQNAARKLLKYFPPKDQDALFAQHATNTLTQIKRKYPNSSLEFLVKRFGAAHISGSFEDLTTPDALGTTGAMHGNEIWQVYQKTKPSAPSGRATPTPVTPLPRSRVIDEINVSGPKGGLPDVGLSGGGGRYGAYREPTRSHAGIDIGTSGQKGWMVGFKASGTVTYAGRGGGYGNLVIIKSGNTEYYFAHLARIFVRLGPYNGEVIGEIGSTGVGRGIHLHYEVRPNGRPIDPKPYLNLLDIGRKTVAPQTAAAKPTTTPAVQIASAKPKTSQTTTQVTPERRGKVIVLPMPETQVAQAPSPTRSSGGGSALTSSSSDTSGLNRYIEQSQYFILA